MKKISVLIAILLLMISTTCFAKNYKAVGSAYIDTDAITQYKGAEGQSFITLVGLEPGRIVNVTILQFDITNKKYRTIYNTGFNRKGGHEREATNTPDVAPNRGWKDMGTIPPNTLKLLTFCQQNPNFIRQTPSLGTIESIEDSIKKLTNDIYGSFGRNPEKLYLQAQDVHHYIDDVRNENTDKTADPVLQLQYLRVKCLERGLAGETSAYGEGGTYARDCKEQLNKLRLSIMDAYKAG